MPWSRADLLAGPRHYVVSLTIGSRQLFYSHEALDITADDGSVVAVSAGLVADIDATRALQIQETSVPLKSVSLSVITEAEDWAAIVAEGWDLAAGVGELAEWIPGRTWEQRQVILTGLLDAPTYGARGEPLAVTLKNHPMQDRAQLLPSTAIVDDDTWPLADDRAKGRSYPTVIGKPGTIGTTRLPGSPGLLVNDVSRYLLIAGHEVEATSVQIADITEDPLLWATHAVTHRTDGRGRTVATVTLQHATPVKYQPGHDYAVCWGYSGAGGGLYNRTRSTSMRTAGDVLAYLFEQSTLSIDRGRTAAAVNQLQGYLIDAYIDEPVGVWEWVQGNLLPILPISIRYGPAGLYPVVWRSVIEDESPLQLLDVDAGDVVRVGVVETSSTLHGELANTIRVAYGIDAMTGDHRAAYLLHGDPDRIVNGTSTASSRITRISVARYGEVPVELQTSVVWDPATAAAVAYQAALRHALPVRRINYLCPQSFGWLEEGSGVQVTDSELSLSNVFGLISEVQDLTDGSVRIQVTLLDPVVRD